MPTGGVFGITSWQDLLRKCGSDIERLRANPTDANAAYDFFVTARHIPEWMFPGEPKKQSDLFAANVELRICRHIADGAKHLVLRHPQHKQVQSSYASGGMFGNLFGNLFGNMFGERGLVIQLDPADAETQQFGTHITALKLAERTMAVLSNVVP